jgi:hypothetical protein
MPAVVLTVIIIEQRAEEIAFAEYVQLVVAS